MFAYVQIVWQSVIIYFLLILQWINCKNLKCSRVFFVVCIKTPTDSHARQYTLSNSFILSVLTHESLLQLQTSQHVRFYVIQGQITVLQAFFPLQEQKYFLHPLAESTSSRPVFTPGTTAFVAALCWSLHGKVRVSARVVTKAMLTLTNVMIIIYL